MINLQPRRLGKNYKDNARNLQDELEKYQKSHEGSIENLINEFGRKREPEIRRIYNEEREIMERRPKFADYLPIFVHKITRQILRVEFEEGYLEKQVKKVDKKHK